MTNSGALENLKTILNSKSLLENPHTKLLIDKSKKEIIFSTEGLKKNVETFLKHLVKVDKDMMELIFEGWSVVSGKYPILPVSYCGLVSKDITFLFNDNFAVILETPENLLDFHSEIVNKDLEDLILLDYVEAVGRIDKTEQSIYKGCLTEYEEDILNKIVISEDKINTLLVDMLSILIPLKWEPHLGWFILGKEYSIVSIYKKWILLETEGLLKNFVVN
ncbi:MAG: hypothetical protein DSY60_00025 [Persephonella sp.]|nr:MAG: hypothetical protein DSY60_00025 [Persephonella sp.]